MKCQVETRDGHPVKVLLEAESEDENLALQIFWQKRTTYLDASAPVSGARRITILSKEEGKQFLPLFDSSRGKH